MEEKDPTIGISNRNSRNLRKQMVEIIVVVTESIFLMLEPDHKIRNVAKLMAWASLASLEQMRRNLENPDSVTFVWRKVDERD